MLHLRLGKHLCQNEREDMKETARSFIDPHLWKYEIV